MLVGILIFFAKDLLVKMNLKVFGVKFIKNLIIEVHFEIF